MQDPNQKVGMQILQSQSTGSHGVGVSQQVQAQVFDDRLAIMQKQGSAKAKKSNS